MRYAKGLLLTVFLFFMAADLQGQELPILDSCGIETNFYAKILAGANFLENTSIQGNIASYYPGYFFACSLGYRWHYGLRFEGEYAFRRNGIKQIHFISQGSSKNGHFQASSFMANLFWDVLLHSYECLLWNLQPFIGTGIGFDVQQMQSSNSRIVFSQNWVPLSWQIMTGLAFPLSRTTEITLEYKFHQGGCHFYNHSIGVGCVYKFGFLR